MVVIVPNLPFSLAALRNTVHITAALNSVWVLNSIYDIPFQLLLTFNRLYDVKLSVTFRLTSRMPVLKQYLYETSPSDYFNPDYPHLQSK